MSQYFSFHEGIFADIEKNPKVELRISGELNIELNLLTKDMTSVVIL